MQKRLLFIEDEINLLNSLAYLLEREGFSVDKAASGEDGLELARDNPPDLVLLDVNLPGIDGFETARRIKREKKTRACPIIMLTARAHPDDIMQSLHEFADDYVTKPFLPGVLLARIHALLRRSGYHPADNEHEQLLHFDNVVINRTAHSVTMGDVPLKLTKSEYEILIMLVSNPDRVYTRMQIIDHMRGDDFAITDRVVDFQVSGLRKKLGEAGRRIETVRGVGYKFSTGIE